nr:unnamed protein product [Spirometra erinaceieuropaei]
MPTASLTVDPDDNHGVFLSSPPHLRRQMPHYTIPLSFSLSSYTFQSATSSIAVDDDDDDEEEEEDDDDDDALLTLSR